MRPSEHRAPFLTQLRRRPDAVLDGDTFPTNLPFLPELDFDLTTKVTFFLGENGSGKSTLLEAVAALCGLPVGGGGRNEAGAGHSPQATSDLAPYLLGSFRRRPPDGFFFRAEFQAHFASLLDARRADPEFGGDPFSRYGGRSLHTRSHGEAFLQVLSAWMRPGIILMDEPEAALSPQRRLALLVQIARLCRSQPVQMLIATHSPILMTLPGATLLSFDDGRIAPVTLQETSHFRITHGILDAPERYWRHLVEED